MDTDAGVLRPSRVIRHVGRFASFGARIRSGACYHHPFSRYPRAPVVRLGARDTPEYAPLRRAVGFRILVEAARQPRAGLILGHPGLACARVDALLSGALLIRSCYASLFHSPVLFCFFHSFLSSFSSFLPFVVSASLLCFAFSFFVCCCACLFCLFLVFVSWQSWKEEREERQEGSKSSEEEALGAAAAAGEAHVGCPRL